MKSKLSTLLALTLLTSLLFGCTKEEVSVIGEYEFSDIAIVGALSSATGDYLFEKRLGTQYTITEDSIRIIDDEHTERYTTISYQKEVMDDKYIKAHFDEIIDGSLIFLFSGYDERYQYVIYDEKGELIRLYLFQLDDDVFIGRYDKSGIILSSLDELKRKSDTTE